VRLTDDDRRKLAERAYRPGRHTLREVATIVAPETLLRWQPATNRPQLDIRQGTGRVVAQLMVRTGGESQGGLHADAGRALKNLGYHGRTLDEARPGDAHFSDENVVAWSYTAAAFARK
jgi:hypothetical protein